MVTLTRMPSASPTRAPIKIPTAVLLKANTGALGSGRHYGRGQAVGGCARSIARRSRAEVKSCLLNGTIR